jgi:hypothetical protein
MIAKFEALPEQSKKEFAALLDAMVEKARIQRDPGRKHRFKFDWAGGLADAYPGMTAVQLQHKISEWR